MGTPPTIELGNLGMADSLILMVLALVVFGPRRLPQIGKQIGKLMFEFRKASNDFKYQMEEELRSAEEAERRKKEEEQKQLLALSAPAQTAFTTAEVPAAGVNSIELSGSSQSSSESPDAPAAEQEEGTLRIQPPSTGEPVMASRPVPRTETAAQETTAEGDSAPQADPATPASSAPATEAVSHNG